MHWLFIHARIRGFTGTWKSVLGWCQTLQPACCFSPPCGCFPIQQGTPRYSCKLMQVFSLHGHCSNGCTLNNAHNNRKVIAFTELSLRCNSCTAFSCLCDPRPLPPLSGGGVSQRQRKLWVFPAAAWGGRRSPGWGSGNMEVFAVARSPAVMFWEFCCLSLYLWHHLQAHFPRALWN